MNEVQILRLRSGEDVVGVIEQYSANGNFGISNPMAVAIDYRDKQSSLLLSHWLPVQIIKKNETVICREEVMATVEPNEEFIEYYISTVQKIQDALKAKDLVKDMDEDQIMDIMDALKDLSNQTIH